RLFRVDQKTKRQLHRVDRYPRTRSASPAVRTPRQPSARRLPRLSRRVPCKRRHIAQDRPGRISNAEVLHMMRRLSVPLLVVLCALSPTVARAQSSLTATIDDLTRASDLVATGHVMDLSTGRDPATGGIYTYVTIELTEVL